jgi:HD domain
MAATYAALYTIGDVEHQDYQPIYTGIYHAVLPITTAFLTFPIWPLTMKSKRFITFFWPIGIGGILFFAGTLLVIMSRFHHMQVMIMMINLLMAVLLLRWPLAFFLAFVGTASGCFLLHYTGTALSVSVPGSFQLLYLLLLFTSLFIARKNKQVYHGLINSYEQLKETSSFSSEVLMETIHQRGQLIREINMYQLGGLDAEVRHTQTKEELWAINAVLRQDIYNLQVHNSHLIQMLHQSQDYLRLTTTDILLEDLLQGVFEDTHEQKRMQVCTHRYTTHRDFQVDVKKMRQLLASGLRYAKAYQQAERPIVLGLEDTLLVYPILSIASYIKQVPSMRITITTGASLPSHQAWYVGNVDSPALHLPRAYSELPITHNQQIVDAHYGTSEFIESAHGMTQIYVIPVRVREVRPQTMDLLSATEVVSDTAIYPAEVAFVQEVTEKIQVDRAMLQQALQLIKQYHAGVKRKSEEPFYLHPIAVAHILLDYTRDRDTIIAALLHDTVAKYQTFVKSDSLAF